MSPIGKARALATAALALIAIVVTAAPSYCQETKGKILGAEEDRIRGELEAMIPSEQMVLFEWGGWLRPQGGTFDDWEGSNHTLFYYDLRRWVSINIDEVHQFYGRVQMAFLDFNDGDSFDGDDEDLEGPDLDVGFYKLNVSGAMKRYFDVEMPVWMDVRVGRQFHEVGSGLVYSETNDGILIRCGAPEWEVSQILSKSNHHEDNIDLSVPGYENSDRRFAGTQLTLNFLDKHRPYVFFLLQRDHTGERPEDPFQEYDYDSEYYGFGSTGEICRNLRYHAEGVIQSGQSFASGTTTDPRDIEAWGFDTGFDYYFDLPTHPRFSFEWAFGSGDKDRRSITNTVDGNAAGTDDHGFLPFGYINTGYALDPVLSNLHFFRFGVSFLPFDWCESLEKWEVGLNFFDYLKHREEGVISDPAADKARGDVGRELDVYTNWRILSDLSFSLRYGVFFPGEAYSDHEARQYLYGSVTYEF